MGVFRAPVVLVLLSAGIDRFAVFVSLCMCSCVSVLRVSRTTVWRGGDRAEGGALRWRLGWGCCAVGGEGGKGIDYLPYSHYTISLLAFRSLDECGRACKCGVCVCVCDGVWLAFVRGDMCSR